MVEEFLLVELNSPLYGGTTEQYGNGCGNKLLDNTENYKELYINNNKFILLLTTIEKFPMASCQVL